MVKIFQFTTKCKITCWVTNLNSKNQNNHSIVITKHTRCNTENCQLPELNVQVALLWQRDRATRLSGIFCSLSYGIICV